MSDTSPKDHDALLAGHVAPATTPIRRTSELLWQVTKDGRALSCELRPVEKVGWELLVREDGELSFSRWCETEAIARARAKGLRQDHLRTGWIDASVGRDAERL